MLRRSKMGAIADFTAGRPKPGQSLFSPRWLTARHRSEAVFNNRRTRAGDGGVEVTPTVRRAST